jgi:hypothetical protein
MGKSKKAAKTKRSAKHNVDTPPAGEVTPALPANEQRAVDPAFERLRRWNKRLAYLYGLEALVVLIFVHGSVAISGLLLGVDHNATAKAGHTMYAPAFHELFRLPLAQAVGLLLAIPAVFHALQTSYIRHEYEEQLKRGENAFRWMESAFSTGLVPLVLGMVIGIRDVASLGMLFVLGFVVHLLGWQYERQLATKQLEDARRSFVMLAVAGLTIWLALGSCIVWTALYGAGLHLAPTLAYGLCFVLVLTYGWVLLQRQRGLGRWADYLYTERTLILLSFLMKSLLAWQILAIGL